MGWSARYLHDGIAIIALNISPEQRVLITFPIIDYPSLIPNLILKPFDIVTLKHLDYKAIRSPQPIRKERKLSEDGSNLANVFHTLYMEKNGVPNRIQAALESVFGENVTVKPELTEDGRTYIKVLEKDFELRPTMVADGLWKLLAIMIAIEIKPTLILIDELENSLHPEAIEYIVNELKNSNSDVIATTHSPAVVDIV
ncbi:recombinase RecF, partial [Candidatus Woesearchaeota archaeon]